MQRSAIRGWLALMIMAMFSPVAWAIYGPSLARTDTSVAVRACQEARFSQGQEVADAMRSGKPDDILRVLGDAMKEWTATPATSEFYPARAFCIHELVPPRLQPGGKHYSPSRIQPTLTVKQFKSLGIEYFYYDPDDEFTLANDPVDLTKLATEHQDSPWERQAFLMMTLMGWSQGGCAEGADQFREVIKHGEEFLNRYPQSEVSNSIRLELANAYATWWNVSQMEPDGYANPENYKPGAEKAKQRAIHLYLEYLKAVQRPSAKVRKQLDALRENPKGSSSYDYFCEDYED